MGKWKGEENGDRRAGLPRPEGGVVGENDPQKSCLGWALRGQPAWPLPWCCQYQLPGRRRPRGEGNWAKGMEGFQASLAQRVGPLQGLSGRGCDPGRA